LTTVILQRSTIAALGLLAILVLGVIHAAVWDVAWFVSAALFLFGTTWRG
jgi:hypothetical protein